MYLFELVFLFLSDMTLDICGTHHARVTYTIVRKRLKMPRTSPDMLCVPVGIRGCWRGAIGPPAPWVDFVVFYICDGWLRAAPDKIS